MTERPIDVPVAELVRSGVFDPDAPDAEQRLATIANAVGLGATVDDLVNANDDIGRLIAQLRLRGVAPRYTLREAASRAGLPVDRVRRLLLATGFADPGPDARAIGDDDVRLFVGLKTASEFFGWERTIQLTRVFGAAMTRVADAMMSTFAVNIGTQSVERELTTDDIAEAAGTAATLVSEAVRALDLLLRRHLSERYRSDLALGADWEGVDTLDRAIGFCDLVGYTGMSAEVSTVDLTRLLDVFETRASDLITERGGNVVKLIGDEVMFVAPDAATGVAIALDLTDAFARDPALGNVRVGLAAGRVVTREGDYFGPHVNVAARLVKLAPESAVLAPATFRELPGFSYEDAGAPVLKGFEEPMPVVVIRR